MAEKIEQFRKELVKLFVEYGLYINSHEADICDLDAEWIAEEAVNNMDYSPTIKIEYKPRPKTNGNPSCHHVFQDFLIEDYNQTRIYRCVLCGYQKGL